MPSTNKTPNIQLNQWVASDHIMTADFNSDNLKIDSLTGALTHVPYVGTNGHWYTWDVATGAYMDSGNTATGPQGIPGEDGKTAYQAALDGGYTGTETEFNASIGSIGAIHNVLSTLIGD